MAQWGNTDDAANSVLWATTQVNLPANTNNQSTLFDNTTVNVFKNNDVAMPVAVGQFGVDTNEAQAARDGASAKVTHAGWVLRTVGTGGRAGRVTNEVLVAMGSMATDASDDTTLPDYKVRVTTNPSNASGNSTNNDSVTFTVAGATKPTGGTISYLWYYSTNGGTTYNTTVGQAAFSGQTTATLTALANTAANGTLVKAVLSSGGTTANTTAATLTVTA